MSNEVLVIIIAVIIIVPPIITLNGGISFKNNHTHKGANNVSVSIKSPMVAEGVVLEPIVIHIKPKANCGTPSKNPIKISWLLKTKDSDKTNP